MIQTIDRIIEYPESDGKPMGETDLHRDWMVRILEIMRQRYRGHRVYVASDLIVYYEEGDPTKSVVPDDFVVKDCDPGRRRTFKIWEEGKVPDVAFEVTSRGSKREDGIWKPQIYAQIGIREYFLYDPTSEYLAPPLQGYRLGQSGYSRIEPNEQGRLECHSLGITLELQDGELVMRDLQTGDVLLTEAEANEHARERAEAERQAAESERKRAEVERKRAEVERKKAEVERKKAEAERKRAEAEQKKAEAERAAALAEREKERAARAAAEARAAELEAELKRLRNQAATGPDDE